MKGEEGIVIVSGARPELMSLLWALFLRLLLLLLLLVLLLLLLQRWAVSVKWIQGELLGTVQGDDIQQEEEVEEEEVVEEGCEEEGEGKVGETTASTPQCK